MSTIYLNGLILNNFKTSPFNKKLTNSVMKKKNDEKILICYQAEKTTNQPISVITNISNSYNLNGVTILRGFEKLTNAILAEKFEKVFVIDEFGSLSPKHFNTLSNYPDFHYYTTTLAFNSLILNETSELDNFIMDVDILHDSSVNFYLSRLIPNKSDFFTTLNQADLSKQPFLKSNTYIVYNQEKKLFILNINSDESNPSNNTSQLITTEDIYIRKETSTKKLRSLDKIDETLDTKKNDEKDKVIYKNLDNIKSLMSKLFSKFDEFDDKVTNINSMDDKLENLEKAISEINSVFPTNKEDIKYYSEQNAISEYVLSIEKEDPLVSFRNNRKEIL